MQAPHHQLSPAIPWLAALALAAATPPINAEAFTVGFVDGKYDPVIQYVVALHDGTLGTVPSSISSYASDSPLSSPTWVAPTNVPEPARIALVAMGLGLVGLGRRSSRPSRAGR